MFKVAAVAATNSVLLKNLAKNHWFSGLEGLLLKNQRTDKLSKALITKVKLLRCCRGLLSIGEKFLQKICSFFLLHHILVVDGETGFFNQV